MGNKKSNPCRSCEIQRASWKSRYNTMRRSRDHFQNLYNVTLRRLRTLQEMCGDASGEVGEYPGDARLYSAATQQRLTNLWKNKASEFYGLLQDRYLDRLTLMKTQQGLINKQNHTLDRRRNKIIENVKTLEEQEDQINTKNRKIAYNLEDAKWRNKINRLLKIIFVIVALCVIVLITEGLISK